MAAFATATKCHHLRYPCQLSPTLQVEYVSTHKLAPEWESVLSELRSRAASNGDGLPAAPASLRRLRRQLRSGVSTGSLTLDALYVHLGDDVVGEDGRSADEWQSNMGEEAGEGGGKGRRLKGGRKPSPRLVILASFPQALTKRGGEIEVNIESNGEGGYDGTSTASEGHGRVVPSRGTKARSVAKQQQQQHTSDPTVHSGHSAAQRGDIQLAALEDWQAPLEALVATSGPGCRPLLSTAGWGVNVAVCPQVGWN